MDCIIFLLFLNIILLGILIKNYITIYNYKHDYEKLIKQFDKITLE